MAQQYEPAIWDEPDAYPIGRSTGCRWFEPWCSTQEHFRAILKKLEHRKLP
jgi:hypothetical protein